MSRRRFRIHGQVQGVFFRRSAEREASRLGVTGFARNEADGSVLIEAEGDDAALDTFAAWCREGPTNARIDQLDVEEIPVETDKGFRSL